jgi:hypothetical protein
MPISLAFLAVALVLWGVGGVVGVGPIFGWVWHSFEAVDQWWAKVLIALGGLGMAAAMGSVVLKVGRWVQDAYRGW